MAGEQAATNLVAEETLGPSSPAPTVVPRPDDGPTIPAAAAGSSSKPIQPPRTSDSGMALEQVPPTLQVHLAAAESRVSSALHQVMESIEKKLLGACKQAAIDIIDNLGREAAEFILVLQRKAAMLEYELNCTKEHALCMMMQAKQLSDAQISAAENKVLVERKRAQEAEARLQIVQESNKNLKAELKRNLQGFQRSNFAVTVQQGLLRKATDGPEKRKGGNRGKSLAGDKKPEQIVGTRNAALHPEVTALDRSVTGITEGVQTENVSDRSLVHSLSYSSAYNAERGVEMCVSAYRISPQERGNLEVMGTGQVTVNKPDVHQGSPTAQIASPVAGDEEPLSHPSEDSHPAAAPNEEVLPALTQTGKPSSFPKEVVESRSVKDWDEEKSDVTVEALYCNDECLLPPVHPGDEYQSNKTHTELDTLDTAHETDMSIHCAEELDINGSLETASPTFLPNMSRPSKSVEGGGTGAQSQDLELPGGVTVEEVDDGFQTRDQIQGSERLGHAESIRTDAAANLSAPERAVPDSHGRSGNVEVEDSNSIGTDVPTEAARTPEAPTESLEKQGTKRKRKQGTKVSKYNDSLVADKTAKRLEADGAVTVPCDVLAAARVDAQISSRDSRRLMQGARQLFSLAEGKWT